MVSFEVYSNHAKHHFLIRKLNDICTIVTKDIQFSPRVLLTKYKDLLKIDANVFLLDSIVEYILQKMK